MSDNNIAVTDLEVSYQVGKEDLTALTGFILDASPGEIIAVVGESGSGKSTAVGAMVGLLPHNATANGSIKLDDEEILHASEKRMRALRGMKIGFVPQDPMTSLNPTKRIWPQVAESLVLHKVCSKKEAKRRVLDLLRLAGLKDVERVAASFPHEISGGMKQRVLIAAAFAGDPDVIIADEPTSALDVTVSQQIMNHFEQLVREQGKTLILITHDLGLAANRADRTIVMKSGEIVEMGPTQQTLKQSTNAYTQKLASKIPQLRLKSEQLTPRHENYESRPVVLEVSGLVKQYQDRFDKTNVVSAVQDANFVIREGSTFALIGESGSGKTTTARLCLRLEEPTSGIIRFQDEDITHVRGAALRNVRKRMQVIYQSPFSSLDPLMNISNLISEPLDIHGVGNRIQRKKRVYELLDAVGLPKDYAERRVTQLSGGQRQRVGIARALAASPKLVVCDEPVSALDVVIQDQVMELLKDLQDEFGMAYLFISHDLALVSGIADEVAIINDGIIVEQGAGHEVFSNPQHEYTKRLLDAAINL